MFGPSEVDFGFEELDDEATSDGDDDDDDDGDDEDEDDEDDDDADDEYDRVSLYIRRTITLGYCYFSLGLKVYSLCRTGFLS